MLFTSPPPGYTFTVIHSKSLSIPWKPDAESASPDSSGALSTFVPTVTSIDHSSLSLANVSWCGLVHARDPFPSRLAQCDCEQQFLALYSLQARSFCERGSETQHLEEDVGKDKGHSLGNGPADPVLGASESPSDADLMFGSEEELDCPGVRPSDSLTDEALLTHTEGDSNVDVGASQGLPVRVEDRGVRMEQRQEPRGPRQVFRWYRKKVLQAAKRLSPQGPTSEELGGGDAGLRGSQTRCLGRSEDVRDVALEEVLGSKSSQTTSQDGQSAPESPFRKRMARWFPCVHPEREGRKQPYPQATGSPVSCAQSRGPDQRRDALPGRKSGKKVRRGFGRHLREKLGRRHAADIPCPQEPLPSPVKFGKAQQEAEVGAQAESPQGSPLSSRAPCCQVANKNSAQEEALYSGKTCPIIPRKRANRQPRTFATFMQRLFHQKHPQSGPHRETMALPNPTCMCQAGLEPPASLGLTNAEGTAFGDCLSFSYETSL